MGYKNYTIRGKTDGFGCQYNAKLSGLAFCLNTPRYRYIHTPFVSVSHGWRSPENVAQLNEFIGIPDNRRGKKIHVPKSFEAKVFNNPNDFYHTSVLEKIRGYYWSTPKPSAADCEIAVHIRRGDIQPHRGDGGRKRRHLPNYWYNIQIPDVAARYPSHYRIAIFSEWSPFDDQNAEEEMTEFQSITNGWPQDLIDRTTFKLGQSEGDGVAEHKFNLITTFHELVTAKVLVMSKSGTSYTAAILNENDVFWVRGSAKGQTKPLYHWVRTHWGG